MKTKSLAVRKPGSPWAWNCLTIRALPPFHLLSHRREAAAGINLDYPGLPSNFNGVLSSKCRLGPCRFRFLGSCSLIGLKVLWEIPLLNNETTACGWDVETDVLQSNPRRRLQTLSPEGPRVFTGKGRIVHLAKHFIPTTEGWRPVPNSSLWGLFQPGWTQAQKEAFHLVHDTWVYSYTVQQQGVTWFLTEDWPWLHEWDVREHKLWRVRGTRHEPEWFYSEPIMTATKPSAAASCSLPTNHGEHCRKETSFWSQALASIGPCRWWDSMSILRTHSFFSWW